MTREFIVPVIQGDLIDDACSQLDYQLLVRCKDCKWHEQSEIFDSYCNNLCIEIPKDWFCADGERKPTQTNAKNDALDVR